MSSRRLLIVSCSARKLKENRTPAWNLYDGTAFRTLKKTEREFGIPTDLDILILSAKYGLIFPTAVIDHYDQPMSNAIAALQSTANCGFLSAFLSTHNYREVFLFAGQTYLLALQPVDSWLPSGVRLIIPPGGIGDKLHELKRWLST